MRRAVPLAALCLAALTLGSAGLAQDVTFSKTRYSSVKQPKEANVLLTITDSKIMIKGQETNGKRWRRMRKPAPLPAASS